MNTLVLLAVCLVILFCGYVFYGRWLVKQWGVGEGDIPTPAHTMNDGIDYVVNSAGALARKVKAIDGTIFGSPEPGFAVVAASKKTLYLYMIDKNGNVLHKVEHKR